MAWSTFGSKLRLCGALLVAGVYSVCTGSSGWSRIGAAFKLWVTEIGRGERVPAAEREKKMEVCRKCPLFFRPLQTCGSPLKRRDRDLGCWCNMEAKTWLRGAHCWIDEECLDEAPYGWRKHGI